jgi:hypothetical protein
MGNLSSQYISQSFQSLLQLGSDNTASATSAEIQDALGNGVGVFVSTAGNLKVTNSISASAISASTLFGIGNTVSYSASVAGQLQALENVTSSLINVTGSYATTGSNNFIGNQNVTGDITLTGTLSAYAVKTIFETSSVIYSSGSNQFGDASNDTQTLIGRTNISGSLSVTGSSIAFKGEVSASYISTSVLQGLGIVSDFSSSVASQFYTNTQLVNSFTQSIVDLNNFSSSAIISIDNLQIFTASAAISLTNLNSFTASVKGTNAFTASINSYTASNNTKWTTLGNLSSSFATTGSNTFIGSNTFTGSLQITGSAYGNVSALTIASNTASIDMSKGNFFTLTLASSATTRLEATNIKAGENVNVLITQPATSGSLVLGSMFKTSTIYPYIVSATGSTRDLVSLVSFDGTSIYTVGANKMS